MKENIKTKISILLLSTSLIVTSCIKKTGVAGEISPVEKAIPTLAVPEKSSRVFNIKWNTALSDNYREFPLIIDNSNLNEDIIVFQDNKVGDKFWEIQVPHGCAMIISGDGLNDLFMLADEDNDDLHDGFKMTSEFIDQILSKYGIGQEYEISVGFIPIMDGLYDELEASGRNSLDGEKFQNG